MSRGVRHLSWWERQRLWQALHSSVTPQSFSPTCRDALKACTAAQNVPTTQIGIFLLRDENQGWSKLKFQIPEDVNLTYFGTEILEKSQDFKKPYRNM